MVEETPKVQLGRRLTRCLYREWLLDPSFPPPWRTTGLVGGAVRPNHKTLAIYLLGVFIGALDMNVLGPAFPAISRSFHIDFAVTAWAITTYSIAYVASTALSGGWGDRMGHRRVFRLGVGLFGIASLLAALSPNWAVFLLARVVQGAGAGAVYPNAQAEGIQQFPAAKRGMALGIFGAVFGVASIIGPNLGGALTQFWGWPTIFLINVPLALLVLMSARGLPTSLANPERDIPDWVGGVAFAMVLAAGLLAISGHSWGFRLVFLALALLAAGGFAYRQRTAPTPFLDARPLVNRVGILLILGAAVIGLDMSSAVFVPALAQHTFGIGPLASGAALMPAAGAGALLSGAGGMMTDRMGARLVLMLGLLSAAGGALLLASTPLTWPRFILAMMLFGVGTAFTVGAPINKLGLSLYRENQAAEALALTAVFRSVGVAAGPIVLTMAEAWHGFRGMYGAVAVASVLGVILFSRVPNRRIPTTEPSTSSQA